MKDEEAEITLANWIPLINEPQLTLNATSPTEKKYVFKVRRANH